LKLISIERITNISSITSIYVVFTLFARNSRWYLRTYEYL